MTGRTGAAAAGATVAGATVAGATAAAGLAERVRQRFAVDGVAATPAAVVTAVRREPSAAVLGDRAVLRLADQVHHQLVGAGPLAPLLCDETVTDVLVNGTEVWVDRGDGLRRAPITFAAPDDVRRLAQRLVAGCGRRLDDGRPYADARLPDGTRLHAVLPPVATGGPYLSLRTFRQRPFDLADLVRHGTVPAAVAPLLTAVVAARLAYLVVGGTGSGKTTMLAALLGLVPPTERIVLVEDAAELRPVHPHVVALQARTSNVEGAGAVGLTDLVRQALRMRPDRLIVGECRGAEIVDLLGALNTGHDGGAGTLHANTPADVPARLEALGLLGGLPRAALHAQILAALQVILHLRRTDHGRVLESVGVLLPAGDQRLATVVPAWRHGTGPGPAAPALARMIADRGVAAPAVLSPSSGGTGLPPSSGAVGRPSSGAVGRAVVRWCWAAVVRWAGAAVVRWCGATVVTGRTWLVAGCLMAGAATVAWPTSLFRRRRSIPGAEAARRRRPRPAPTVVLSRVTAWCVGQPRRAVFVAGGAASAAGWIAAGPVAAAVTGAYAALGARAALRRIARSRLTAAHAAALDDLCALAADLRAGLPAPHPLPVSLPVSLPADRAAPVDARLGRLAAAVWRLAERTGAPAADLVERIEADARAGDRARASAAAQAAGAQATALLLACLPAGGIALGYGIGVDPLRVLLHTPLGAACAVGTVLLQGAGLAWADRLARGPS